MRFCFSICTSLSTVWFSCMRPAVRIVSPRRPDWWSALRVRPKCCCQPWNLWVSLELLLNIDMVTSPWDTRGILYLKGFFTSFDFLSSSMLPLVSPWAASVSACSRFFKELHALDSNCQLYLGEWWLDLNFFPGWFSPQVKSPTRGRGSKRLLNEKSSCFTWGVGGIYIAWGPSERSSLPVYSNSSIS